MTTTSILPSTAQPYRGTCWVCHRRRICRVLPVATTYTCYFLVLCRHCAKPSSIAGLCPDGTRASQLVP